MFKNINFNLSMKSFKLIFHFNYHILLKNKFKNLTLYHICLYEYQNIYFYFLKILFIYFLERGREGGRGREVSVCGCLLHAPYWGPVPQPRHAPYLGIKLATLWFTGQHSIH